MILIPSSTVSTSLCIPVFTPKRYKNPTRWGGKVLYGFYKGAPPPPPGIGESLLTSLFTFFLISIRLTHRSRGHINELNAKVKTGDNVEQFVQFSAPCKQY